MPDAQRDLPDVIADALDAADELSAEFDAAGPEAHRRETPSAARQRPVAPRAPGGAGAEAAQTRNGAPAASGSAGPAEPDRPATSPPDGVRHWLLSVARASGARDADRLVAPATLRIADAWAAVAAGCDLTDEQVAQLVATHYRLGVADLAGANPDVQPRIPERIARKYNVFPLRERDGHLVLATSDPTDHDAEQALRFASRKRPIFEIAPPAAIRALIQSKYSSNRMLEALLGTVDAESADIRVVQDVAPESVGDDEIDAAPIIKLTNLILRDAVREGASDIHLEPNGGAAVVRLRVDGVLRHHMQIPLQALTRVVSRIKILGELDIADRLRPQDGRTRIHVDGRTHDLRISTVPTRGTEKAVIRILNPEGNRTLDDLAMPRHELSRVRQLLAYRDGITVVTGPTGSGKTTTLYAALREVATGEVNVMSVEDPVEYELAAVTQIQVETDRGVTFASALRAILRQDPDIIFVGEIRDPETAEVAVHASMTGHLVLATLHTNDAVSSVARLEQLGLDGASIAATLRGAIAQRLLRRVCSQCAQRVDGALTPEEQRLASLYGTQPIVRARGCARCGQTGYKGRIPVIEVMHSNVYMRELIADRAGMSDLTRAALAGGMRPILTAGIGRVASGHTTLHEIERVLGGVSADLQDGDGVAARIYADAMRESERPHAT